MTHSKANRAVAIAVFLISLTVYLRTLSPTVVFWDVGEFIAAAKLMQVPHPPGSPLFLIAARVAMMIPFAADQAVRAHALSAVLSATAIMFLYLVCVRVIVNFRRKPVSLFDGIAVYGASAVGALSLAFGTTYWDNSIEAEVYGASMFFVSSILWLALRWSEKADEEGSEKYILFIAYLIGLSLGVHLLALLAIFPVLMIMYFRKYEVTFNSFAWFTAATLVIFAVVYPGIVKYLPGMMDGEFGGVKSEVVAYIPWIILAFVCYGVYTSYQNRQKMLHIGLLSILLIFLGYTTYTSVLIRSNANPPMNENDPNNLARLTSYLGREQYGSAPTFMPRRWSTEPNQQGIYTRYSSDMDYMLRYQLYHMFVRYLFWNYVGAAGDAQDSGATAKDTWAIPLIIGLLGVYYQFKKDWKMGLVFLTAFIVLGPILALYQNQQEPQPRERDYFYVGAFFVFSLWIAIGIVACMDYIRDLIKRSGFAENAAAWTALGAFVVVIPANLIRINYHDHDRSGNYVAWDYSYNMLQTCEKNAILFTNGDNDTFPLWYLQDVEGIRRDVRIVNLSLINTPWYIQQMKKKPYYPEAHAVPISIPDSRIPGIGPVAWEPRVVEVRVPKEVYGEFGVTDTAVINTGKIAWMMRNSVQYGQTKAIRVQDILVRNIIETNQWKWPIYFAVTCAPDSRIGLDEYLWFDGLAQRLEPKKIGRGDLGINESVLEANLMHEPKGFSKTPQYGYKFRGVSDPNVYFDENITRLMLNIRWAFIRLAMVYANQDSDQAKAATVLDRMDEIIPQSKIPIGWELGSDLAGFYYRIGRMDKFRALVAVIEPECKALIASGQADMSSYYNPYRALIEIYDLNKEYHKELELLQSIQTRYYQNDPTLKSEPALKQRIALVERQAAMEDSLSQAPPQGNAP
jgi:hypothetical protein